MSREPLNELSKRNRRGNENTTINVFFDISSEESWVQLPSLTWHLTRKGADEFSF